VSRGGQINVRSWNRSVGARANPACYPCNRNREDLEGQLVRGEDSDGGGVDRRRSRNSFRRSTRMGVTSGKACALRCEAVPPAVSGPSPKAKPRLSRRGPARVVPSGGRPSNAQSQPAARAVVPSERPRTSTSRSWVDRCLGACIEAIGALHGAHRLRARNESRRRKINVRSWNSALSWMGEP
jgi:hypothetical protein